MYGPLKIKGTSCSTYDDVFKIVVSWMAGLEELKVVHTAPGSCPCANLVEKAIYIPPMNGLSQKDLMLARLYYYHEVGHIIHTEDLGKDTPKGALFSILNALEDYREEKCMCKKHSGTSLVFQWGAEYFNLRIAGQVRDGEAEGSPLWEALCAMGLVANSLRPAWDLTETAKKYYDAALDTFLEVKQATSVRDCLEIAKRIYDILKKIKKDIEKEEQKKEPQNGGESSEQNDDGSYDVFFGPEAPAGKEKTWVKTVPGKGWFTYIRLYGPLGPFFDQTWKPDDIVMI